MFNSAQKQAFGGRRTLVLAGAVMDGAGMFARPGALALSEDGRVAYAGPPEGVPEGFRSPETLELRLPDRLLIPGMVNAHAHLDLSFLPRWAYGGDFTEWVGQVMTERAASVAPWDGAYLYALGMSRAAGVTAVGDIVGGGRVEDALKWMDRLGMQGVAFAEEFGHDTRVLEHGNPSGKRGLQPHAPYSAGPALFKSACKSGSPLSIHLAETLEEAQFVASATGPFRDLLERLGKWKPEIAANYSAGLSPVQWMEPYLRQAPWLLAHVNYASDDDLAILARTGASVVYCPVASDYFLHKNHRYRDMLAAGINVCLGTDSMICQPKLRRLEFGILAQMRHLFRRDKVEAKTLLAMATVNGAKALGLTVKNFTFAPGAMADPLAVQFDAALHAAPLDQVLWRADGIEWLSTLVGLSVTDKRAAEDPGFLELERQWGLGPYNGDLHEQV